MSRATLLVGLLAAFATFAHASELRGGDVSVRGYTRRDGTYVPPHMRSAPDRLFSNNWSTRGNSNPFTGEPGTKLGPGLPGRNVGGVSGPMPRVTTPAPAPARAGREPAAGADGPGLAPDGARRIADWDRKVAADPGNALALGGRAFEYHNQGAYDRAIADYSKAIELNGTESRYYHNRGMVYLAKGEPDRAIPDFHEAIRREPGFADPYLGLSEAYRKKAAQAAGRSEGPGAVLGKSE